MLACGGSSTPGAEHPQQRGPTEPQVVEAPTPPDPVAARRALDRFGFGPRPEDVDAVAQLGARRWLLAQLSVPAAPGREAVPDAFAAAFESPSGAFLRAGRARAQGEDPELKAGDLLAAAQMAALARHINAEAGLAEVMVDFWTNHFNVYARKGHAVWLISDYVETVIRPHALGRFEDMLVASAHHPAMLIYLDNVVSIAPGSQRQHPERGLNENYARELLELHTLGVNGGYTQQDVIEVARILTGWGVAAPRRGDFGFQFRPQLHDRRPKSVLGRSFEGSDESEGLELLRFLAHHRSTARFVAEKLVQRFVADEAPAACVERVATAFEESSGEISQVLRALWSCPVLWQPASSCKLKTPVELVVSAVRVLGGSVDDSVQLARALASLGQAPFLEPAPTGYPHTSPQWLGSGAMLARFALAQQLAERSLPGVEIPDQGAPEGEALVHWAAERVLAGKDCSGVEEAIGEALRDAPEGGAALALSIALASPEFQCK